MTSFDIAALVSRLARRDRTTEADIQSDIRTLLLHGGLDLGTDDVVTMESQAGAGKRIDVEVGYCVIEVKRDDLETRPDRRRLAEEQLAGYLRQRHDLTGQQHSGILTDGANWYLYRLSAEGLQQIGTFRLRADNPDAEGLCTWLEDVIATRQRINPTPDVVAQKLGYRSVSFDLALAQLRDIYEACRHMPEVQIKRELWARLLRSALGENFTNDDELFIRHTYLVVTAELIAHAAIGHRLDGISYDAATLLSGKLFGDADIGGVVEADFFDWPLHSPDGPKYVLELARRLGRFSWENVDHDVLKVLYESVIDAETRHSLGEYYTPDWLAEKMVAEAVTDPLDQRVLDPACGSGTFLFWAVRRYLKAAEAAGLSNIEALEGVCRQVTGVDLHPVAVTLARVTYLLALQDRLHHPEGRPEIRIPVYLGDSVQWEEDPTLLGSGGLVIRTTQDQGEMFAQEIRFPDSVVADAANFDRLVDALVTRATTRTSTAVPNIDAILAAHGVTGSDRDTVTEAFEILCRLHDDRRNHIWGYYIRNQARPAWLSRPENRVDVLVGNPPWLAYRYMDAGRQERFRELAGERGLWAGAEVATHQDLSALFVVRAVELYLREGGSFAFVMPAAALSRRQFAGFRRGEYHTETQRTAVAFGEPWDLTEVEPTIFPVPASVIFGERTPHPQPLGLKARAWSGTLGSHFARWEAVADKLVEVATVTAVADDAPTSPYSRIFSQGATLVPRVLVTVTEADPGPLGTKAGTTRVASARSSLEKKPWKNLDGLVHTVEDEFLRPMYVGTSIVPYRAWDPGMAVVPYADGKLLSGQDPDIDRYPGLASWWRDAERLWEKNKASGSQMTLRDRIDYQRTLINQFPIAPQRVVYTKAGTNLVAARINDTRAVIDHKLYWAAVGSTEEALFLCAILNSEALRLRVRPLQSRGQFGPRDFDKYVFCIPFPNYDPDNPAHVTIADLGARAEEVSMSVEIPPGVNYQTARRQVSDALTADGVAEEIEEKVSALLEEAVREAAEAALD